VVDGLSGIIGIILGVLALVGINPPYLVPSALIVFGGALILSGAIRPPPKTSQSTAPEGRHKSFPTTVRLPPAGWRS
jgi:hypothetical protein